jgi:hypothetical protein
VCIVAHITVQLADKYSVPLLVGILLALIIKNVDDGWSVHKPVPKIPIQHAALRRASLTRSSRRLTVWLAFQSTKELAVVIGAWVQPYHRWLLELEYSAIPSVVIRA